MKTIHEKNTLALAVACAFALGAASFAVHAQVGTPVSQTDLLTDVRGTVATSGTGLCWHSAFGPPPVSSALCDPNYRPAAVAVAPAPQPVAAAPAPKPVVVAAVNRSPVVSKVKLDADTLFDFDKADLRPEGRKVLDEMVGKLAGIDLETITTIGHTDRFGTDSYNQALSARRADTVKAYLVARGVRADRVHNEGKGETQPVTKSADCAGGKSAKVIACLQPDRRVDIEVIGTRTTQ